MTKEDLRVYTGMWDAAQPEADGKLGAVAAVALFDTAGLLGADLAAIWAVADSDQSGRLPRDQFFVALKLIALRQAGHPVDLSMLATPSPAPVFRWVLTPPRCVGSVLSSRSSSS